jgi:signal transduction histidine kinase
VLSKQTAAELRHTLRTPINHISGYSEILLEDLAQVPDGAEATRLLTAIREDAKRNLDAIQNVLSAELDGVPGSALGELQHRMSQPIERMQRTSEALELMLPPEMLGDLGRIRSAIGELAAEIEMSNGAVPEPSATVQVHAAPPVIATGSGTILVVDDNEGNRDMLSRRLARAGYSTVIAEGGEDALKLLQEQRFDLILLDLIMPGVNGLQVIEKIKADPELCQTPVILISALDDMETVARCIELGAEDYLFKPVNPVLLRARVRSTLERRRAQEALRRKQQLESIGALAAGVAHDFNNLLTGILGNACMLQESLPPTDANRYFTEEIVKSSERAADLTRQLLAYSGKGRYRIETLDLSMLVSGAISTIRALLPPNVELRWDLPRIPPASGDSDQLRQVILNLVTNAGEAVDGRTGTVSLATGTEEIFSELADADPGLRDLPSGNYVYLEVCDTGQGMDPESVARIFDPFYTTKFFGRGLGLAAVAGIVRMHGGGMRVSTVPKQGSRFRVFLPVKCQS